MSPVTVLQEIKYGYVFPYVKTQRRIREYIESEYDFPNWRKYMIGTGGYNAMFVNIRVEINLR